jgi:hypothetical protein
MSELIYAVIGIVGGIAVALLFPIIKGFITSSMTKVVKEKLGASVDNTYTKQSLLAKIKYDLQPIKILTSSVRTILLCLAIAGAVYGYGYWRGKVNAPVHLNLQGKAATISLNEHFLKIDQDGSMCVVDKNGTVLKRIKVKDIPELAKQLKPFGFVVKPIMVMGAGVGEDVKYEAGGGLQFFKYYKWYLNGFVTNGGAYIGPSYRITENSDVIGGIGKGWKLDTRVFLGWKFRF